MRLQKVLIVLLSCLLLFLIFCPQTTLEQLAAPVSKAFDDLSEDFRFRSLEKKYPSLQEPSYITWQTARHYYEALSDKEKLAYRCIYNEIFTHPDRITVPRLTREEFNTVFAALRYDNPQLLFLAESATLQTAGLYCYFEPEYSKNYWDARQTLDAVILQAQNVLAQCDRTADDYSVLLFLHDYLCSHCTYVDVIDSWQCYTALLDGESTCAGYAKALKLLLDFAKIDNCIVTGNASQDGTDINHMWLAVCLDGTWVFCDPTWDDPVSEDGEQTVEHGYFSVSEQRLSLTHSEIQMPSHISCDSEEYDYYIMENLFCTQENYMSVISDGISQALQDEKGYSEYRFDTAETLQEVTQVLIEKGGIYYVLDVISLTYEDLNSESICYAVDENRLQMKLVFVFYE